MTSSPGQRDFRPVLFVLAGCVFVVVLVLAVGGVWFVRNWDRIPELAAGDSYTNWQRGMSVPWPGGGPSPSSDGSLIAYSSPRSGRGDIYVWDRATRKSTRLTDSDDFEGQPFFSPDNQLLAYQRQQRDQGRWRIWLMNADGSNQRALSNPARGNDGYPEFTADGKRVQFLRTTWAGGLGAHAKYSEMDLASEMETTTAAANQRINDGLLEEGATLLVGTSYDPQNLRTQIWIEPKGGGGRRVIAEGAYPKLVRNESELLFAGEYARGLWMVGIDGKNKRQIFKESGYILMQPRLHSGNKVVLILDRFQPPQRLQLWEVDLTTETAQLLTQID